MAADRVTYGVAPYTKAGADGGAGIGPRLNRLAQQYAGAINVLKALLHKEAC